MKNRFYIEKKAPTTRIVIGGFYGGLYEVYSISDTSAVEGVGIWTVGPLGRAPKASARAVATAIMVPSSSSSAGGGSTKSFHLHALVRCKASSSRYEVTQKYIFLQTLELIYSTT